MTERFHATSGGTVVVTGAGGFMGRHLVADQLARGRRVRALDLHLDALAPLDSTGLQLLTGDVADPALARHAVAGADLVFHLAAAHLSVSAPDAEFQRVNVEGTRALGEAALEAGVSRFVHCSTVGVYGVLESPPADEETPCEPEFAYERTKLQGERALLALSRERGLPLVVLRPGWVYGPGCARTEKLFRTISRGRFVVAGRGDSLRHSVYIRDAVRAFHLASTADAVGEVILLADGGAVSVRELVDRVAELEGVSPPRSVPAWLLYLAGLAAEAAFAPLGKEPPVSRRSLRFFSGNTSFVTEKAVRLLGFRAEYGIGEGLAETRALRERGDFWSVPLPPAPSRG